MGGKQKSILILPALLLAGVTCLPRSHPRDLLTDRRDAPGPAPLAPGPVVEKSPTLLPIARAGAASFSREAARLAELIRNDRYCSEEDLSLRNSRANSGAEIAPDGEPTENLRSRLLYEALSLAEGEGPAPCVQAMLSRDRAEALAFANQNETFGCRFLRGLLLSGQWEPAGAAASDPEREEGLAILRGLAAEDTDNGLLAFFELGALGESDEAARERAYFAMLQARRFQNPLRPMLQSLGRLGRPNPTAYLYSVEILSTVGVPRYSRAARAAKALAAKGLYPESLAEWSARLAEAFAEEDRLKETEPNVSPLQNAVARSVVMAGRAFLPAIPPVLESENWLEYYRRRLRSEIPNVEIGGTCEDDLARASAAHRVWLSEFSRQLTL